MLILNRIYNIKRSVLFFYALFSLVLFFSIYGDLLKRVMVPSAALAVVYAIPLLAGVFLVRSNGNSYQLANKVAFIFLCLIFVYAAQILFQISRFSTATLSYLLYIIVPVIILVSGIKSVSSIQLKVLVFIFCTFMLPQHFVGFVQYFIQEDFGLSSYYNPSGGVIVRGFLSTADNYSRYPALFVSADRYAGLSAVQVASCAVFFNGSMGRYRTLIIFLAIMFVACGLFGSLVSGVRSRMLIGFASLLIPLCFSFLTSFARSKKNPNFRKLLLVTLAVTVCLAGFYYLGSDVFKSVEMVRQTFVTGDIYVRFYDLWIRSFPNVDTSFFGDGIGAIGAKPSEFGIMSMWIESGWFFTPILLVCYSLYVCLCAVATFYALRCDFIGEASIILCFVGLLLFGIFAGLTTNFEIALGGTLFLFTGIAFRNLIQRFSKIEIRTRSYKQNID